jgi:Cd2+/Zn2+-exporting ATPase
MESAEQRRIQVPIAVGVEEVAANGMHGIVNGAECVVGKLDFARRYVPLGDEVSDAVEQLGTRGATALVVVADGKVMGVIGVADTLRESASAAMRQLAEGKEGRNLEMLTGDNRHAASAVAAQAGIERVSAELLPEEKLARIDELQSSGRVVAMVGDGMNDAPALAKADLGVTMGAAASDTALEVADVALLSDGLEQLPAFFHLAARAMNVVRENICFAIGVKVICLILGALGFANMWTAVFADVGVMVLAVLNAMRCML